MEVYIDENLESYAFPIKNYICKVDNDTWQRYRQYERGRFWDVIDGEFRVLAEVLDPTDLRERLFDLKGRLSRTDYVVTKMAEAQVVAPETVPALREEYAQVLTDRVAWRREVNDLRERYGLE